MPEGLSRVRFTLRFDDFGSFRSPAVPMSVEKEAKLLECGFHLRGGIAETMPPGEDVLLVMYFGVGLYAVGAEGLQAVYVHAEVCDFFSGVLVALQSGTVGGLHYNCGEVWHIIGQFK